MEPCTRELFEGQVIGDPCPDCGHTNVLHPGEHNPVVEECVLCTLTSLNALLLGLSERAERS